MKLFLNGDSNTAGTDVDFEDSIPYFLEQGLGATNVTNLALMGASNDYIYETTMEYLRDNAPDFVIIGWSDPGRFQWFDSETGKTAQINRLNMSEIKVVPEEYREIEYLIRNLTHPGSEFYSQMGLYWHIQIFNLHQYLRYRNIPHLFFNAFELFTGKEFRPSEIRVNWKNQYYNPYTIDGSYVQYCIKNNYKDVIDGHFHFERAGQQAWANLLLEHIKENDLIH